MADAFIYTPVPNFVKIFQSAANLWRFTLFQNGGSSPSWIIISQYWTTHELFLLTATSASLCSNFVLIDFIVSKIMLNQIFCKFGLKRLLTPPKFAFWGFWPSIHYLASSDKAFPSRSLRWYVDRKNRSAIATCTRVEETKKRTKNNKNSHKQWYFTHAPRPPT